MNALLLPSLSLALHICQLKGRIATKQVLHWIPTSRTTVKISRLFVSKLASMAERQTKHPIFGPKIDVPLMHRLDQPQEHPPQHSQPNIPNTTLENDEKAKVAPSDSQATSSQVTTALTMLALCMATFLAALDMTIVTTALPTIASAFDASSSDYSWIGSSYLLGAAASTPTWGKLSDIFGRKPILLTANVVFFIGSLICALSVNVGMLLAGRAIQGVGGGGLTVMTQICIGDLFSMRVRAMFYGIVSMMWAFACAIGPILGGVFTQRVSWRWAFYINLPCDGAAFIIIVLFIKIDTPRTPILKGLQAIDWAGSLAIIGGTVMFLLGLNFGNVSFPWNSATVICTVVFGVASLMAFFAIEAWIPKYPIMPLRIFNSVSNIASLLTCSFQSLVFIAGTYFLPLYFQDVLLVSPLLSGIYLLPFVVSLALSAAASGVFIRKTGVYRPLIWFGMTFLTIGFGVFINLTPYASWPRIIIYQIIAGVGAGPNFQAPLIALQNRTKPQDVASATATFLFARNLATAMSIVFGGAIFDNRLSKLVALSRVLPDGVKQKVGSSLTSADQQFVSMLPPSYRSALVRAYTTALQDIWIFYTCAAAVGLSASLLIQQKVLSSEHEVLKQGLETEAQEADAGSYGKNN